MQISLTVESPPGFNSISWQIYIHLSHFDSTTLYAGGNICPPLSAICLLSPYILLRSLIWTAHWETDTDIFYCNSSASFTLRSLLGSCSFAIRREHTLAVNTDLYVFNNRLHATGTPWLRTTTTPIHRGALSWSSNNSCCSEFWSNQP